MRSRHANRSWLILVASALLGCAGALASLRWGSPVQWPARLAALGLGAFGSIGPTVIALGPLSVWLLVLVGRQLAFPDDLNPGLAKDYEVISTMGPVLGLLGTVMALVSAGAELGQEVQSGSSANAVLAIIPKVAQALVSTAVGIVIQIIAEGALHLLQKKHPSLA
jgi:hypothetical protein